MSRESFEAWIKLDSTLSVERDGDGDGYRDMDVYLMWRAWQAARADAYERAANTAADFLTRGRSPMGRSVAVAIRALAKEAAS